MPGISAVSPPISGQPNSSQAREKPETMASTERGPCAPGRRSRGRRGATHPGRGCRRRSGPRGRSRRCRGLPASVATRILVPTPSVEATRTGSSNRLEVGPEHAAEGTDLGEDGGIEGRPRQGLDPGLGGVSGGDVDTGVAVVHTGFGSLAPFGRPDHDRDREVERACFSEGDVVHLECAWSDQTLGGAS